jgi:hypothetical protein
LVKFISPQLIQGLNRNVFPKIPATTRLALSIGEVACQEATRKQDPYPIGTGTNDRDSRARFSHSLAFTPLIKSHKGNAISAIAIG